MRNSIMARETRDWMAALETASQRTGGRLVNSYASAGLATPLLEIANEIAGQYVLTYSRAALTARHRDAGDPDRHRARGRHRARDAGHHDLACRPSRASAAGACGGNGLTRSAPVFAS